MKTMSKMFAFIILLAVSSAGLFAEMESSMLKERILVIIKEDSMDKWRNETLAIIQERNNLIETLLTQFRSEQNPMKKIWICYLLGEYKAAEAVEDLSNAITLQSISGHPEPTKEAGKRLPLWGKYPAYEALVKIGLPSIPVMIRNLETEGDNTVRQLSASVICKIQGSEIARIIIENRAGKQVDAQKKKNLVEALKLVQ